MLLMIRAALGLPKPKAPAISAPMLRFGLILALVVVIADQITKWLILGPAAMSPPGCLEAGIGCGFIELSPVVDLRMVWNRGMSFGMFAAENDGSRWFLVAVMLAIAALFGSWLRTAERRLTGIAIGLVVGGAVGNVIDRIRFGAVTDFIDFSGPWFGWTIGNWPVGFAWVFNVADAAISVGAVLLAIDFMFFSENEPGKAQRGGNSAPS